MDDFDPQPSIYERRAGEPNLWYDRFHSFMLLGPERTLIRCYRQVSNAERAAKGRPPLPATARCPQVWRLRASQFDWWDRAEAWDRHQRCLNLEKVEKSLRLAREHARRAMQVQIDIMRGQLKDPGGRLADGQNSTQRRLAADSVLDRAGAFFDALHPEGDHSPEITGITISVVDRDYQLDDRHDFDELA